MPYVERSEAISSPETRLWLTVINTNQQDARRGDSGAICWFYSSMFQTVSHLLFSPGERAAILRVALRQDEKKVLRVNKPRKPWTPERHQKHERLKAAKLKAKEVEQNVIQRFSQKQTEHTCSISEMSAATGNSNNPGGWEAWRAAP